MDWLDDNLACRTVEDRVAYLAKHLGDKFESAYTKDRERVKWVGDTDGDGVADASTVFADNFGATADGIIAGVLEHKGKVYAACMPSLLGALRRRWRPHRRSEAHPEHGLRRAFRAHRPRPARAADRARWEAVLLVRRPRAQRADAGRRPAAERVQRSGAALQPRRLEPRDLRDGPAQSAGARVRRVGELWTVDNNSDGGDKARLVHVVEGMDAGWRQAYQWITEPNLRGPWNDEGLWKPHFNGQAAYIVPPLANICDGPSGLTYNPGTALGGAHANTFFICDFRGDAGNSGIHTFTVKPRVQGSRSTSSRSSCGARSSPTATSGPMARCGSPTGSRAGTDRQGPHVPPRAERRARKGRGNAADAQRGLGARRDDEEPAKRLGHVDQRVRQLAQLEPWRATTRRRCCAWRRTRRPANSRDCTLSGAWGSAISIR